MIALQEKSEIYLLNDNSGQKNDLKVKYIMELSKLKKTTPHELF